MANSNDPTSSTRRNVIVGGAGLLAAVGIAPVACAQVRQLLAGAGQAALPTGPGKPPAIGMNIAPINYYGTQYPLIDFWKTGGAFAVQGPKWEGMNVPVDMDADGYPLAIPAGARQIYTVLGLPPASPAAPVRYVLSWTGRATISIGGVRVISSGRGKLVFDYTGTSTSGVQAAIAGIDSADPPKNIRLIRSDRVAEAARGDLFDPLFLAKVSRWSCIRFMDWGRVNSSKITTWESRPKFSDASWGSALGVPLEVMVTLCNQARSDMWYCVPHEADDNFIKQALGYIRDNLASGLKLYLEYSNEVWNWAFAQAQYALAQGDRLWGTDANKDGRIDPKDPNEHVGPGWLLFYGYRAAQLMHMAMDVFGANWSKRLIRVVGTQTYNPDVGTKVMQGAAKAKLGPASGLFDQLAVTTYFGGEMAGSKPVDQAITLRLANAGEQGVTDGIKELLSGSLGYSFNNSLAALPPLYAQHAAIARANGLKGLVAYEGGLGLDTLHFQGADQVVALEYFGRLAADPRMAGLYDRMIDDFAAAGGTLLVQFNDVGPASKFGLWGALPTINDTSPRDAALAEASKKVRSPAKAM